LNNGKHGKRTHSTNMGADSSAENTSNAPKFICPICLPKPKSLWIIQFISLNFISDVKILVCLDDAKGQLISKCPFVVFKSTKKTTTVL
jgi:hypothetical protein